MHVEQEVGHVPAAHPDELAALVRLSLRLGADPRLTQGAGGNLSVTTDDVLWIKASGTRLAEAAEREIFVPMDARATRSAVLETEDLVPFVLPWDGATGLRPSIETALHALLPHPVVAHVHGVGSIAAGLSAGAERALAELPASADTVVVPYAKPGVALARTVLDAGDDLDGDRPVVLLLRNHGLVVGARDAEEAGDLLDLVEATLRRAPAPGEAQDAAGELLCPAGTVDAAAAAVLCTGPLTPDSAVFLGPRPFSLLGAVPGPPGEPGSAAFIADDGSVRLRTGLGPDEREIALSLVDVARQVAGGAVQALSPADVDELVNWEAEKWRRSQKR
jgi:ribulose-5-phosphate 4-epimerase/fuculose-1-phosphate aldolase